MCKTEYEWSPAELLLDPEVYEAIEEYLCRTLMEKRLERMLDELKANGVMWPGQEEDND